MPDIGEFMGLYSIGAYDRLNSWFYGGITLFTVMTGRRGGFFTGGYTLELSISPILDAGGYVGRWCRCARRRTNDPAHIGLKYDLSWSALGLNYSYVDSPMEIFPAMQ